MKESRFASPIGLLLLATTFWGVASALLSQFNGTYGAGAPIITLGASASLTAIILASGSRPNWNSLRPCLLLQLGLLEAVNIGMYAAALRIGSTFVVVALHLTSPVFLLLYSILFGKERQKALTLIQLTMIALAISLFGSQSSPQGSDQNFLLAAALGLGSAAAVAALIYLVSKNSAHVNPDFAAAIQLAIAAILTSPLLVAGTSIEARQAGILIGIGAFFLGPGFALYWRALRTVDSSTAALIGLNEALVATVLTTFLFNEVLSLRTLISGFLILAAIIFRTISRQRSSCESGP